MSVTVIPVAEGATPTAAPTKAAATQAALDKLAGKKPDAEPGAAVADKPASEPAATKPPGAESDVRTAIELERSAQELQRVRGEAREATLALQAEREAHAARSKDWRRALADAGHTDIDAIMVEYVSGDKPAGGGTTAPAAGAQSSSELAELKRELAELKGQLTKGAQQYTRAQRLEAMRALAKGGGEEFSALTALESEDRLLSQIEALEQARGGERLGDVETREAMAKFEKSTRDAVAAQIKKLGNTPWARKLMQELLQELADAPGAGVTTTAARTDLMNGDGAPALRSRTLAGPELREAARAKAMQALERRKAGLS